MEVGKMGFTGGTGFTAQQIAEIEAVAKVLADPIVRESDKVILAEMLRVRMEGSE